MRAMTLQQHSLLAHNPKPLELVEMPVPQPGAGEILIQVAACGVCHTELDEIEGRLPPPLLPVILGHQVVGRVVDLGPGAVTEARMPYAPKQGPGAGMKSQPSSLQVGERVGVAWIYSACGECAYCRAGNENLCARFQATGKDAHGGYGEYMLARRDFVYRIPPLFSDAEAAPLLCAGAIGYRSLRLAGLQDGERLGLTGFGASAHLVIKMARQRFPNSEVFVFSRSPQERQFALELGAAWTGDIDQPAPALLESIIDTTPAWKPVVAALANLAPGGRLVINAIRKEAADQEELLRLSYPAHLWMEKEIKSVANVTRQDASEFLALAAEIPIRPEVQLYPLEDANQALLELKNRRIRGAKVLIIG